MYENQCYALYVLPPSDGNKVHVKAYINSSQIEYLAMKYHGIQFIVFFSCF